MMKRLDRASLLVLLLATGALSVGLVSLWLDVTTPSDGARLPHGHSVWRAQGVVVAPLAEHPDGLRRGDLVVAVDGRSMESWAQALLVPAIPRPRWEFGQTVVYTVVRDGSPLEIPVSVQGYPLGAAVVEDWGIVLFALVFQLLAAFVFFKRPRDRAARTLLVAASCVSANVLGGLGLQVNDLVGGIGFWLFQATNFFGPIGMLFLSAIVHFALAFPRPQPIVGRHPWTIPLLYAAPYAVQAVYVSAMQPLSSSTLEWIARSVGSPLPLVYFGLFAVALVSGYYHAHDAISRQQMRWVVWAGVASASFALVFGMLPQLALGQALADLNAQALFGLLVPVAIVAAILRYRVFDIDVIMNRALVYGALTTCVVAAYVLVVGYLGALLGTGDNLAISLVAVGLVAVLFQPVREQVQRGVNRLIYGDRDEPYEVIARLGHRLEATIAPEAVLPTIVESVARALKLPHASLWLVEDGALRLAAAHGGKPGVAGVRDPGAAAALRAHPDGLPRDDFDRESPYKVVLSELGVDLILPLGHRGELVGALCLAPRGPGEGFSAADRRLLRYLASQAGAAVHGVRLSLALKTSLEELRRSRERLVAAQEEERRRIQRDLHDGLGPVLASTRLRLEACLDLAQGGSAELIGELERLHELVGQATADIRRLVYDLRPPSLAQLGLVPTLRQQLGRFGSDTAVAVRFDADPELALPAAAEVAIFRVAQEALVNVQKHAQASEVDVRLRQEGGWLTLQIRDNGVGLSADGAGAGSGTGLRSMRERAEQLGGTLEVNSRDGAGTELLLRIPVRR